MNKTHLLAATFAGLAAIASLCAQTSNPGAGSSPAQTPADDVIGTNRENGAGKNKSSERTHDGIDPAHTSPTPSPTATPPDDIVGTNEGSGADTKASPSPKPNR